MRHQVKEHAQNKLKICKAKIPVVKLTLRMIIHVMDLQQKMENTTHTGIS